MAAPTSYPSWVYNLTQPAVIVANLTQFNALPGTWTTIPFAANPANAPADAGFTDTDTRLQQILIENRIQNQLLQYGFNLVDDPVTQIRPDVLANDSSLSS